MSAGIAIDVALWGVVARAGSNYVIIGVNHPAIVREILHFDIFPAFPHFC